MRLSKTFSFDAAHKIPGYDGPCANIHGHSWTWELVVIGKIDPSTGMVMDFKKLKEIGEGYNKILDHKFLNDIMRMPTAENIAKYLYQQIQYEMKIFPNIQLQEVNVWEQPTSKATYSHFDEEKSQ